jgi:hypothetical protein
MVRFPQSSFGVARRSGHPVHDRGAMSYLLTRKSSTLLRNLRNHIMQPRHLIRRAFQSAAATRSAGCCRPQEADHRRQFRSPGDRGFESRFLQRRVHCELELPTT